MSSKKKPSPKPPVTPSPEARVHTRKEEIEEEPFQVRITETTRETLREEKAVVEIRIGVYMPLFSGALSDSSMGVLLNALSSIAESLQSAVHVPAPKATAKH